MTRIESSGRLALGLAMAAAVGAALGGSATAQTVPIRAYEAGNVDNCALPGDAAFRGAALEQWGQNVTWEAFDSDAINRHFGHTFGPLPPGVYSARLVLGMKPDNSSQSFNDGITIGLDEGTLAWSWGSRIEALPEAAGSWRATTHPNVVEFQLDLAALPGGMNLIPQIAADRRLDVRVQDDTCIDYCRLEVQSNGLQLGGVHVDALAGATLQPNGTGFDVMLDGQGNGELVFPIGPVDAIGGGAQGLCIMGDLCDDPRFRNSVMEWVCEGYTRTTTTEDATAVLAIGEKPGSPGTAQVSVFGEGMFDDCVEVHVYQNGQWVASTTLQPPPADNVMVEFPSDVCSMYGGFDFVSGRCFYLRRLSRPVDIHIPGAGLTVQGDSIKICDCTEQMEGVTQGRLRLRNYGRRQLRLDGMALAMAGDALVTGKGGAGLATRRDTIAVQGLDNPGAKATVMLGRSGGALVDWTSESLQASGDGDSVSAVLHGHSAGAANASALGSVTFTKSGLWRRATWTNQVGATVYDIEIQRGGQTVWTQSGVPAPVLEAVDFPRALGTAGGEQLSYFACFDPNTPIRVSGRLITGTHLTIRASGGAAIRDYTAIDLSTNGFDELDLERISVVRLLGGGCQGSQGAPWASSSTLPLLGSTWMVDLRDAAPNAPAALNLSARELPIALPGGCTLMLEPWVSFPVLTDATGSATTGIALPFDTGLLDLRLLVQHAVVDIPGPLFGVAVLGDAAEGTIGR